MNFSKIDAIETKIREQIASGVLPAGAMLPSRRHLSEEFQVAVGTVERAIGRLLADGTLRADERRGTFVAGSVRSVSGWSGKAVKSEPVTEKVLGIIADYANDFRVLTITRAIEETFSEAGGVTRFYTQDRGADGFQPLTDAVEVMQKSGVGALIIVGINDRPGALREVENTFRSNRLPVVYISGQEADTPINHVYYDSQDAGYQAARYLLDLGHEQLAFLMPFMAPWVTARWQGAQNAVRHAGLPDGALLRWPPVASDNAWDCDQRESGINAGQTLLAQDTLPTAVIAVNDLVAEGFLRAQAVAGERARALSVIGFDDTVEARLLGLTSLRPPLEKLGTEAARLILRVLGGEVIPSRVRLRSHLVARATTHPFPISSTLSEGKV